MIMKKNMGMADRTIRIVIAVAVAVLYWLGIIEGMLAYVFLAFAAVFLLTSFISFCPLYTFLGTNSCPRK